MTVSAPHTARPAHGRGDGVLADIIGSDRCQAEGFTARSSSPVLAICRKLIEAEVDPDLPLRAYRGNVLCLAIRSIGEAARLIVKSAGNGVPIFAVSTGHEGAAAPPVRQSGAAHPRVYRAGARNGQSATADGADHAAHSSQRRKRDGTVTPPG